MNNCPNCGAPVTAHICEYCGTVLSTKYSSYSSVEVDKYNELLKTKTKHYVDTMSLTNLYEEALRAIRRYCE